MERSKSKLIEHKSKLADDSRANKSNQILSVNCHASNFLMLNLQTKRSITEHLEQFSSQLFSKAITKNWTEEALNDNSDLLLQLISLPYKENESSEKPKKRMKSILTRVREPTGSSVFDLSSEFRLKLIEKLLDIQHQLRTGLETGVNKHKLAEENNQIIHFLTDLPRRIVEETESDLKRPMNDQLDKSIDVYERLSELETKVTNLKTDLNQAMDEFCSKSDANTGANKLEKQIARLKEEIGQSIGKLKALNSQPNELVEWKASGSSKPLLFDYQIDEISEFFKTNGHKCSENFLCCGISWSLAVQALDKIEVNGQKSKYLSCILAYFGESKKLECQTYFELRLLSQTPSRVHKVTTSYYTFSTLNGFGFPTFISEFELFDPSMGFVKNDSIKLQVYLKIEKLNQINTL